MEMYFEYLRDLRDSGKVNMFEAPNYLVAEFGIDKDEAIKIFKEWVAQT